MNKLISIVFTAWMFIACPLMAAEDFATLIFNHQIAIGMTFGNVQAAWGKPVKVDKSVSRDGVTEYWFFENGWLVVFENGRVASFHR
jgi:hypothetical protein